MYDIYDFRLPEEHCGQRYIQSDLGDSGSKLVASLPRLAIVPSCLPHAKQSPCCTSRQHRPRRVSRQSKSSFRPAQAELKARRQSRVSAYTNAAVVHSLCVTVSASGVYISNLLGFAHIGPSLPLSELGQLLVSRHPNASLLGSVLEKSSWAVDAEMVEDPAAVVLRGGEEVAVICPVSGG